MRLLIVFQLFPILVFGQHKYIPFPDSIAIWTIKYVGQHSSHLGGHQYFLHGKETIGQYEYSRLYNSNDSSLKIADTNVFFGIRNDTSKKRVYIYPKISGKEFLLYDFSLQVGDTIPIVYGGTGFYYKRVITNIDSVQIKNKWHHVFEVDSGEVSPIIEGIGGLSGPLESPDFFEGGSLLSCLMLGSNRTEYYKRLGESCSLFHYNSIDEHSNFNIDIFPIPITFESTVSWTKVKVNNIVIVDQSGRKITLDIPNNNELRLNDFVKSKGIHLIHIETSDGGVYSKRFIKN